MMTGLPPFYKENRKDMFNSIKNSPLHNHHRIQVTTKAKTNETNEEEDSVICR